MNYTTGIDVSHWQGKINWSEVAKTEEKFAIIKATEGTHYKDARFRENIIGAREAGLAVGAYHYMRWDVVGKDQALHFLDVISEFDLDFPPVLDCEEAFRANTATDCIWQARNEICVLGKCPIIYTRKSWWDRYVNPSSHWKECPLWVAHWTTAEQPLIPRDWDEWYIWQYGQVEAKKYKITGSKTVDINRMKSEVIPPTPEPEPEPDVVPASIAVVVNGVIYSGDTVLKRNV